MRGWPAWAIAAGVLALRPSMPAMANCVTAGATTTCDTNGPNPYTSTVGTGPATPSPFTLQVGPGAQIQVVDRNGVSLHDNATINLQSNASVQTTTTHPDSGQGLYGKGDNAVEFNNNSIVTIQPGASVIAAGVGTSSEAINPIGSGNQIINYGLIEGIPSSAIFFENVNTNASSPRNSVVNFGTIEAIPAGSNPGLTGEAIGSFNNVGIDFTNEPGAKVVGNLDFQGGDDNVTLYPGSQITGNFNGGGGFNTLTLNGQAGSSDSLTGNVVNFQTLTKTGLGTWTLTGAIGNSGGGSAPLAVEVQNGLLVLTGNNTGFRGSMLIDLPGTLEARAQSLPPLVTDNGLLLVNQVSPDGIQPADGTYTGQILGNGVLTKIGAGTLTLAPLAPSGNTYTGGTNLNSGSIAVSADNVLGAATGPLTFNGGTLRFDSSFNLASTRTITLNSPGGTIDTFGNTTTISQPIAGAGGLTETDSTGTAGRVILTGANNYTGGTTITAGTIQLGAGGTSGSILGNVADNGTLAFNRTDAIVFPGLISGTGGLAQIGTGRTILTANDSYTGETVISAGTLQLGNGGGTVGRVIGPILNNGALVFDRADIASNPGQISGTGSVAQIGTGTEILSATNTYTGGTTITAGTLQIGDGATSGSIVGNVTDNAALAFNRSDIVTFPGVVSGTGLLAQYGGGTIILTGTNSYTGGTRIASGTLQLGNGGTTGSIVGDVSATSGILAFDRSDTVVFPGVISGAGGTLAQIGIGTTILTGANSYTGGTTITAGTLQLGNGGTSGSIAGDVVNNATLAFDRRDVATVPAFISGTGAVAQIGTGTTILTANSSYTGGTTISAGVLQLGNGGASGRIIGDIANDGRLVFDRSDVTSLPGAVSGTGSVAQIGAGTEILTGTNTYTGGTTISAGTLQLGNGGTVGGIVGSVADNGTLAFNRSDTLTFPGVISGSGGVSQIGSGTTILTAANTYSGGTTISTGTLAVGDSSHGAAALSGGGPTVIAGGATLAGYGSVTGPVVNDGTIAVGNALPLFASGPVGTFTINGALQNAGLLNLAAPGAPGNVLSVTGNYTAVGSASTLAVATVLNAGGPLSNQFTDRLLIAGSDPGTTSVQVRAVGSGTFTSTGIPDAADGISIIQVAGDSSADAFALPGGYITGGTPFQYHLNAYGPGSPNGPAFASQSLVGNAGNQWDYRLQNAYVSPIGPEPPEPVPPTPPTPPTPPGPGPTPQPPTPPVPPNARLELAPQVPAYITAPTALFNAGFQDLDSLHRRLGEIRDDQIQGRSQQGEVFLRAYGGRFNYSSDRSFTDYGFNSSQDYAATQFGGNWIARDDADGTLRVGLAGTIGQLWFQPSAVDGASKGFFNTETLAGIVTWQSRAGWYVDGIVAGGMFDGQITTPTRGQTTGMNGTSVAASVEAGYPIPLGWQGLAVEPQAQLVYQHLDFARRTDVDGINVDLGSPNQGVFRGGARLTKQFAGTDSMLFTPYLKANVLQGIDGGDAVHFSNVAFGTGRFGTALQVGGGITGTLTRNLSVYGDVAWQHDVGGGGTRGWAFNGGLRYAFGEAPPPLPASGAGAPAPAPSRTYLVFFDWDKATLTDRARQIVGEAAISSTRVQLTRIQVNGYTDTSGTAAYNQRLSVRRAEAVAAELVRDGVPRNAISIQGFGETHLLVPTGPGVREPQNRRVEIVLR